MAHTVIPPPRGPTATLELAHKGNINDKTIPERDREVRDFNVTLLASAITRRRHLVIDTQNEVRAHHFGKPCAYPISPGEANFTTHLGSSYQIFPLISGQS